MTVKKLREEAKRRGLKGFSRLRKADLVALLAGDAVPSTPATMTVVALRAECKARGLRGYSRLTKAALLKLLDMRPKTDDEQLVAAIATLPANLAETRAVYKYLAGIRTKPVLDVMTAREYQAAKSIRDQQETQAGWSRWNAKVATLAGVVLH